MYKVLQKSLREWNDNTSDRLKLQHAYVVSAIMLLIGAGLIGLVNYELGQRIVTFALLCIGAFLVNLVMWALLSGLVLIRFNRTQATKPSATNKKR